MTKACAHDVVAAATRIDDFILFNNIDIVISTTSNKDDRGVVKRVIDVIQMGSNRKRVSEQKIM